MSYQIAGRMSWLVSWLDHWRGHPYVNDTTHTADREVRSRDWMQSNHLNNVSPDFTGADEDLISQTFVARQLKESVEQLPSHERQVLLLHVSNGLTYWEIAERLGMDEEVVLRDLAHAYSQLRLNMSLDELRR